LTSSVLANFSGYSKLLRMPGTLKFVLAGCIGRFPISMRSLACFMLISAERDSYALAGAIASVVTLCQAVASPALGRLADRQRQGRIILASMAVHTVGIVALVLLARADAAAWALVVAAAVVGASSLPLGSLVRARWAALVGGTPRLHTAYALEAFIDDLVYMGGPAIVTTTAVLFPAAGLLAVLLFVLVGWTALALQRGTEPTPLPRADASTQQAAIAEPGMRVLLLVFAALGAWLGSIHVSMVAFAEEAGAPGAGGLLIGIMVLGSMIAGIVYGAVQWRSGAVPRLFAIAGILSVGSLPLALVGPLWLMCLLALTAGIGITPLLVSGYSLLGNLVPKGATTEAFSWVASSIAVGTSAGTAAAGALVDGGGSGRAYLFVAGCALFMVIGTAAGRKKLARTPYATASGTPPEKAAKTQLQDEER
jgi:MFS family permease